MTTLIRLTCKLEEEHKAFLGEVPDENLLSICNEVVLTTTIAMNFIIHAVKNDSGAWFFGEWE